MVRYLAARSFAMSSSVTEVATHRPCGPGLDMIGQLEAMKSNLGVLKLEVGRAEERVRVK